MEIKSKSHCLAIATAEYACDGALAQIGSVAMEINHIVWQ